MSRSPFEAAPPAAALTAVSYARFSSDLQREASIADQHRACSTGIGRQGWHAGPAYADRAASGSSTAFRRGYQDLLEGVGRGSFQVVVAESLDRLSRDQEHSAALYKRACYHEAIIFTLSEGEVEE